MMEQQKNTDKVALGDIVRIARHNKNLSQEALAERIGVCKKTIIDIENNIGNPKFDLFYKLVRELELPLEQVYHPDVSENFDLQHVLLQETNHCSEYEMKIIVSMVRGLKAALREENKNKTKE